MTPAIKTLERTGTNHCVLSYEHDPKITAFGTEAADALGIDPSQVFKTLLADVQSIDGQSTGPAKETVVAVLPVTAMLNLKLLAKATNTKTVSYTHLTLPTTPYV